jgi:hypothetical protein
MAFCDGTFPAAGSAAKCAATALAVTDVPGRGEPSGPSAPAPADAGSRAARTAPAASGGCSAQGSGARHSAPGPGSILARHRGRPSVACAAHPAPGRAAGGALSGAGLRRLPPLGLSRGQPGRFRASQPDLAERRVARIVTSLDPDERVTLGFFALTT